jgi:hypothetical protein
VSITHLEVRRHPLWREQATAGNDRGTRKSARVGLVIAGLGVVSLVAALLLIALN